jgi:PAS domain S-box-containing protein
MKKRPSVSKENRRLAEFSGPALLIAAGVDGSFAIAAANGPFLHETGYRLTDLVGAALPGQLGPGSQLLSDLAATALQDGRPKDGAISLVTPLGPRRHRIVVIPQEDGEVVVLATDTTTGEAVRYLDDVLVTVKDIIWSIVVDSPVFNYVSNSVEAILGIKPEDLLTQPKGWVRHVHPDDLERFNANWHAALDGAFFDIEYRMIRPDTGEIVWVHDRSEPVRDADGHIVRVDGIAQDITALREVAERARAVEALYRTIVENQVELICRYRPDMTVVFCNAAYARLYNTSPGQLIGRSFAERLLPEEITEVQMVIDNLVAGRASSQVEQAKTLPGGEVHWFSWTDVAVLDQHGHIREIQAVGRDVTERRRMERDLQNSEHRLRLAIESIPDAFAMFDAEDRLVVCNKLYRTLALAPHLPNPIGKTFEELAAETAASSVGSLDAAQGRAAWLERRLERHRDPPSGPIEVRINDGRWLRVNERRTPDGGWVGIWSDITPLKQAELRLRTAIGAINEGFVMYDENERLVLCNDRYRELYSRSAAAMTPGATLEGILRFGAEHGEYPNAVGDIENWLVGAVERVRKSGRIVYERRTAEDRWVLVSRSPLPDGGFVGIITDVSELKIRESELESSQVKLQQQAQHLTELAQQLRNAHSVAETANRAKSRFLAHMSHELRTPLNAILGFADIIRSGTFGTVAPTRYGEYVQYIHESGSHLLEMINDVLDLSKIEAGRYDLKPEPLNARALAEAGSKLVAGMAKDSGVALTIEVENDDIVINADSRATKQIIINLLSNAVKFTPSGGFVSLDIRRQGSVGINIVVTDTGIGMSKDDIAKAVDPYGQIDGTLARQHRGTGLGLPLVKTLAELQGGQLSIDSAPSRGTRVTVFLPIDARPFDKPPRAVAS